MKTKTGINRSFAKRAVMVLAVLLTALTAGATEFITEVKLIGAAQGTEIDKLIAQYEGDGWKRVKPDLNSGIPEGKGDWVYLLYKTAENTDGLNHGYITDFYLQNKGAASTGNTLTHNGRTYNLTPYDGDSHFMSVKGDLNSGTGWDTDAIHLYYTTDPFPDNRAVTGVSVDQDKSGAVGKEGSSTAYDLNSGCEALTSKKLYLHFTTAAATTLPAVKYISYSYDSQKGLTSKEETCYGYYTVTSSTTMLKKGWYVVSGNVEISDRIKVNGTVNLILCDGCTLTAESGIDVWEGNTLNIFAQSEGDEAGALKASGYYYKMGNIIKNGAAIGGFTDMESKTDYTINQCGAVTIHGGNVEAGFMNEENVTIGCAGIGGGYLGNGGTVTVYGGVVKADGGDVTAGIGGGLAVNLLNLQQSSANWGNGGIVRIYGGIVDTRGKTGIGRGGYMDENFIPSNGTLEIGRGITVFSCNGKVPTAIIAQGPQNNVNSRSAYMIVSAYPKGDANCDKKVDAADIVFIEAKQKGEPLKGFCSWAADMDGDTAITPADIDAVVKIILKK